MHRSRFLVAAVRAALPLAMTALPGRSGGPSFLPSFARVAFVLLALALVTGCTTTAKDELAGQTAEKLYRDAQEEASSGAYERAIRALERVEGLAAGTLLAQQAQIEQAYLQWRSGERAQAQATIDRYIRLNPSSPALDYAMYLRGLVNFNDSLGLLGSLARQDLAERDQRASRDAYASFKQLVDQFPDSRYAADARLRMDYIVNSLAAYEVHVARYYFRRGAYLAAANRAQQAIREFERSPSTEEALYIMVQSYERLELKTLRDDAERVLRQNFPESRFIAQGLSERPRAWWQLW
jgi:outer membrane protein assembly factor BamD